MKKTRLLFSSLGLAMIIVSLSSCGAEKDTPTGDEAAPVTQADAEDAVEEEELTAEEEKAESALFEAAAKTEITADNAAAEADRLAAEIEADLAM